VLSEFLALGEYQYHRLVRNCLREILFRITRVGFFENSWHCVNWQGLAPAQGRSSYKSIADISPNDSVGIETVAA